MCSFKVNGTWSLLLLLVAGNSALMAWFAKLVIDAFNTHIRHKLQCD